MMVKRAMNRGHWIGKFKFLVFFFFSLPDLDQLNFKVLGQSR